MTIDELPTEAVARDATRTIHAASSLILLGINIYREALRARMDEVKCERCGELERVIEAMAADSWLKIIRQIDGQWYWWDARIAGSASRGYPTAHDAALAALKAKEQK